MGAMPTKARFPSSGISLAIDRLVKPLTRVFGNDRAGRNVRSRLPFRRNAGLAVPAASEGSAMMSCWHGADDTIRCAIGFSIADISDACSTSGVQPNPRAKRGNELSKLPTMGIERRSASALTCVKTQRGSAGRLSEACRDFIIQIDSLGNGDEVARCFEGRQERSHRLAGICRSAAPCRPSPARQ